MTVAVILALVLFGLCGAIHFTAMSTVLHRVGNSNLGSASRMLIGFYSAGFAHLTEAGLYAIGFELARSIGLGDFNTLSGSVGPMETYYFSIVNYTSLGLGDIYPTGHLRFMAGVESLNGFLLISSSAAFIFLLVSGHEPLKNSHMEL